MRKKAEAIDPLEGEFDGVVYGTDVSEENDFYYITIEKEDKALTKQDIVKVLDAIAQYYHKQLKKNQEVTIILPKTPNKPL